jgi:hypothetical protein
VSWRENYIFAGSHALNGHPLEFPGVSFPLHFPFLSRKVCPSLVMRRPMEHESRSTKAGEVESGGNQDSN